MGFERGTVSYRIFEAPRTLPEDALDRVMENSAPAIDHIVEGKVMGWVTGRHMLDRRIEDETVNFGGYYRLALMQAEKKIPTSLLKAEIQQEELARKSARGAEFLSRKERTEIREEITARLLPQMPPQLKSTPYIHNPESLRFYCGALNDKACDEFNIYFTHTFGYSAVPISPESAAMSRKRVDTRDMYASSFSPEVADELVDDNIGRDFLTWLWFVSEEREGVIDIPNVGRFAILIQGPLTFTMEGAGAHETTLRKGNPTLSAEAKTSLLSGKKISKAKFAFALGETLYEVTVGDDFVFRSLKLSDPEESLDAVSLFMERMQQINDLSEAFLGAYDIFIDLRSDREKWKAERTKIHKWVNDRKGVQ